MGLSALQIAAGLSVAWLLKVILQKYAALTSVSDSLKRAPRFTCPTRSRYSCLLAFSRVCPGGSILWQHPFRFLAMVTGPFFPPKGFMGYYTAKFSSQSVCCWYIPDSFLFVASVQEMRKHLSILRRLLECSACLLDIRRGRNKDSVLVSHCVS